MFPYLLILLVALTQSDIAEGAEREQPRSIAEGLDKPTDLAIRDDGRLYVLDGLRSRVVVFTAEGERDFTFAHDGQGEGQLHLPMGIAIDGDRVFIADSGNQRIAIFNLRGEFQTNIDLKSEQQAEPVALHVVDGKVLFSDRRNHRICRIDIPLKGELHCFGEYGESEGQFRYPLQLAGDEQGYIHVVDVLNARLQVFTPEGRHISQLARFGTGPGELIRPNGLAPSHGGDIFISDSYTAAVFLFRQGDYQGKLTIPAAPGYAFAAPTGIKVRGGRLYVVDAWGSRVLIYDLARLPLMTEDGTNSAKPKVSRRNCVMCHVSWSGFMELESTKIKPVATLRMCYSCHHGAIIESRASIARGKQHPNYHHKRQERNSTDSPDKIDAAFPKQGKDELYCGSCHTPHNRHDTNTVTHKPWMRVQNANSQACIKCHEKRVSSAVDKRYPRDGRNHPVGIHLRKAPVAGDPRYASSEKLHEGLPKTLARKGAQLGSKDQMTCQTCHKLHGGESEKILVATANQLCVSCHERHSSADRKEARARGVHPVNIKLEKKVTIDDEEIGKLDCLSCHSVHQGVKGSALLRQEARDGKLCSHCHEGAETVVNSDHDLRVTAKDSRNRHGQSPKESGVCGACHSMHRGADTLPALYAGKFKQDNAQKSPLARDRLCLDCHRKQGLAGKSLVEHFDHPADDMVLRSNPEHMPLVDAKGQNSETGRIACATCHDPHRWQRKRAGKAEAETLPVRPFNRKGTVMDSFLRRGPREAFCVDCHGGDTLLKYLYYHDTLGRQERIDYLR